MSDRKGHIVRSGFLLRTFESVSEAGDDPEINVIRSSFTAIERDWVPEIAALKLLWGHVSLEASLWCGFF